MENQPIFETDRLLIRPIKTKDTKAYFEIFGSQDVAKFDDFEPISEIDAQEDVKRIVAKEIETNSEEFEWAVSIKQNDDLIGVLYFKPTEVQIFVGYHFHGNSRGKGFAREAVSGLISYLKKNYEQKIVAKVDSENKRSIHLLTQLGFQRDEEYAITQFFKNENHIEWYYFL